MDKKDQSLIEKAKKRFDYATEFWRDVYERGDSDNEFAYGDQWPEAVKAEREKEKRPCLTENHLLQFTHQVINETRQMRPSIIPVPVDDKADVDKANVFKEIIRNIQKKSDAESAYDTAIRNAVLRGIGYIRIGTDYCNDNDFTQDIQIIRVNNPNAVLVDPDHKRLDGADIEYAFIFDDMSVEEFRESYPDADAESFEGADDNWRSGDTIRVAEYYYKVYETKRLVKTFEGYVGYKDEFPEGTKFVMERDVDVPSIKYCKMTGTQVLEKTDILGKYIPIVPVVGEEAFINGRRDMYSLIHQARDPQYMLNIWKSVSAEVIGLQPKAPYIGVVGQFNTYATQWSNANIKNYPFLPYDFVVDPETGVPAPPPQRQMPIQGSPHLLQEAQMAGEAIKSALGIYNAAAGEQTNDVSGKAIIARQVKSDTATFHFMDNLVTAMKQVGRILVDLIPLYYDEPRVLKIKGEDGQERVFPINQAVIKQGDGYRVPVSGETPNALLMMTEGEYDIDIDVGADFQTKRQEAANAILELGRVIPQMAEVAPDLLAKSLDIPNADDIAKRLQAVMNPSLFGDDPEAQRLIELSKMVEGLQAKLQETEAALQIKRDNEEFKNQLELAKIQLDKEKLQLEATKAAGQLNNERIQVEAEAIKDIAEANKDMADIKAQMQDVIGAIDVILSAKEVEANGEPLNTSGNLTQGE